MNVTQLGILRLIQMHGPQSIDELFLKLHDVDRFLTIEDVIEECLLLMIYYELQPLDGYKTLVMGLKKGITK